MRAFCHLPKCRPCNASPCCSWTAWSPWSECSATCGSGGYRSRTRQCSCYTVGARSRAIEDWLISRAIRTNKPSVFFPIWERWESARIEESTEQVKSENRGKTTRKLELLNHNSTVCTRNSSKYSRALHVYCCLLNIISLLALSNKQHKENRVRKKARQLSSKPSLQLNNYYYFSHIESNWRFLFILSVVFRLEKITKTNT